MPTNITFRFLTNETYFFNDVQTWYLLAQYVKAIICYNINCNIVDIANQLFYTYYNIALELKVFVSPLTKAIKTSDFIYTFEAK